MQKDKNKYIDATELNKDDDKTLYNEYNNPLKALMSIDKSINTDPFGSWTGVPTDNFFDKPIQDVDDL